MLKEVSHRISSGCEGRPSKPVQERGRIARLLIAAVGFHCVIGGCGTALDDTTQLDVVFDRTGTLQRDVSFENITTGIIQIGDAGVPLSPIRTFCGFVSLNLDPIPETANVTKVVLNLKATIGRGNPFDDFGAITVDHVDVVSGISASDYTGGTIQASIATIQPFPATTRRDVAIDITSQVNADRAAGRPISSFRFRFDAAPSADGLTDAVVIESSVDDPGQRPSATVTISE